MNNKRIFALLPALFLALSGLPLKAETTTEHQRVVPVDSVRNFRDLGGYTGAEGKTVVWNTLYRSSSLHALSYDGMREFADLGIKTVCDLRTDKEIRQAPDRLPPSQEIEYLHLDIMGTAAKASGQEVDIEKMIRTLLADLSKVDDYMAKGYVANATLAAPAYAEMFQELLDKPGQPLLLHCQAGKDRTGVGSALILLALGVDEETILDDYMISEQQYQLSPEELAQNAKQYHLPPEVLTKFGTVKRSWMQPVFNTIKAQYGSYDAYFEQALGLDSEKITQLRATYLE